jgi:hypothetical protein
MSGPAWTRMNDLPRRPASTTSVRSIPSAPGVYAWYETGIPIYAGKASGRGGLRERLGKHLGTGVDLSRSSLRRNVAEHLLEIPTALSRQRPSVMTTDQVAEINSWIHGLALAWLILPSPVEAIEFERELLGEWMPSLSKR